MPISSTSWPRPSSRSSQIVTAAKLSWKPAIYLNNVASSVVYVQQAIKASSPDAAEGIVSTVYLKDPTDKVKWATSPA